MSDIHFEDYGSIWLVRPQTAAGQAWCDENLPSDAQMFGNAIAVETRFVEAIGIGASNDGMEISS